MRAARRRWLGQALAGGLLAAGSRPGSAIGAAAATVPSTSRAPEGPAAVWRLWPHGPVERPTREFTETVVERSQDPAVRDRFRQGVTQPSLEWFPAARPNGSAAIIIPGGGYRRIVMDKEGYELAGWLAARGVQAFVLFYRLPPEGWASGAEAPLADAQRAVRLVRSCAARLGIEPSRVGVVGYSAGGHLAANLTQRHADRVTPPADAIDEHAARPDFTGLVYAAVAPNLLASATGGAEGMFGAGTTPAMLEANSPYLHVRPDSPPHCLVHAEDDPLVPVEQALLMREALRRHQVPVDTHLFARGGHGFGLRHTRGLPVAAWPEELIAFGRSTGWIPA